MASSVDADGDLLAGGDFDDRSVNLSRAIWELSDEGLMSELGRRLDTLTKLRRPRIRTYRLTVGVAVSLALVAVAGWLTTYGPTAVALLFAAASVITFAAAFRIWGGCTDPEQHQMDVIELIRQTQIYRRH